MTDVVERGAVRYEYECPECKKRLMSFDVAQVMCPLCNKLMKLVAFYGSIKPRLKCKDDMLGYA